MLPRVLVATTHFVCPSAPPPAPPRARPSRRAALAVAGLTLAAAGLGASLTPGPAGASSGTGEVAAFGDAAGHGQPGPAASGSVVAMAATPSGNGYWLVGDDGGIFAFGDAALLRLDRQPCTSTNRSSAWPPPRPASGYWLVGADGGIFTFGDAAFYGSTGGHPAQPAHRRHGRHADRAGATGSSPPTAASSPSATPRFYGSTGGRCA